MISLVPAYQCDSLIVLYMKPPVLNYRYITALFAVTEKNNNANFGT